MIMEIDQIIEMQKEKLTRELNQFMEVLEQK